MMVLVTGGTGLVGGNLIRELVRRGDEVIALVRKNSNTITFDDRTNGSVKFNYSDVEKANLKIDLAKEFGGKRR